MNVPERVLEKRIRCQLITWNLASCLAREPLMPFSSCHKYKRNTKQRRSYKLYYAFVNFEKAFDRVPSEVLR